MTDYGQNAASSVKMTSSPTRIRLQFQIVMKGEISLWWRSVYRGQCPFSAVSNALDARHPYPYPYTASLKSHSNMFNRIINKITNYWKFNQFNIKGIALNWVI